MTTTLRAEPTFDKLLRSHDGHFCRVDNSPWADDDDKVLEDFLDMLEHVESHDVVECGMTVPPDQLKTVGRAEWIGIRKTEDYTVDELAQLLGVTKGSVSRWETGRRDPDNLRYFEWLRDADGRQVDRIAFDIWRMIVARDGWTADTLRRYGSENHWEAVWKDRGLVAKWRKTGTLPHFTPADAGVA